MHSIFLPQVFASSKTRAIKQERTIFMTIFIVMNILIKNIRSLAGIRNRDMNQFRYNEFRLFPSLEYAFLLTADGKIEAYGLMTDLGRLSTENSMLRSVLEGSNRSTTEITDAS